MIDQAEFGEGLGIIALQLNQSLGAETIKAHWLALGAETDAIEWPAFCAVAAKRKGWIYLPSVVQLLDSLREFRGVPPLLAEASEAYERVLNAGTYGAESGTTWSFRDVRDRCGVAAAEAFLCAGGSKSFETTWDEARRRERFIAAYADSVRDDPCTALLPAGPAEQKALPAPASPSIAEAREILRGIAEDAKTPDPPKRREVVASEERLSQLRAQAAEIQREETEA